MKNGAESELELSYETRDGERIEVTTGRWTRRGIAEVGVRRPDEFVYEGTVITAKQARELASHFDKLAAYWGE
jgi:hypothetical protein